jgi:branched-chain amino acid transport system substrate-binding protein
MRCGLACRQQAVSGISLVRRRFFSWALALLSLLAVLPARANEEAATWKIGELNSYAAYPQFAEPYRRGWQLALAEVNAAGGVLGRPLEVISLDDGASRQSAARRAQELVVNHGADILAGTYLSNVGLGVSATAAKYRRVFLAVGPQTDALTWDHGNRHTFRLRPSTYMQAAMLVEQAAAMPAKRWAIVASNYEYGQSAVANFRAMLKARRPDVEFVEEQWPALGKIDAPAVMAALARARPDAVFNATFGPDLVQLLNESRRTRVFEQARLVSMASADPQVIAALKSTALAGWAVAGYPAGDIALPQFQRFRLAYLERYRQEPQLSSLMGYSMIKAIAQGIIRARGVDTEDLIGAMRGMAFDTPLGSVSFRAIDHQSTMGAFIGRYSARMQGGQAAVQWNYADGSRYLPSEEFVRGRRPASAMR